MYPPFRYFTSLRVGQAPLHKNDRIVIIVRSYRANIVKVDNVAIIVHVS